MKAFAIRILKKTPVYYPLRHWAAQRKWTAELAEWESRGRPVPPPHLIKQRVLREHATRYGLRILVETGTYYGDMVEAMRADFDRVYSIELSQDLYEKAVTKFAGISNVELIQGDSGSELKRIVETIREPALFWLDGHYSAGVTARGAKDTPVYEELDHILGRKDAGHVIVIDDARCFGNDPGYPSIDALSAFVKSKASEVDIAVRDDSIRITPRSSPGTTGRAGAV